MVGISGIVTAYLGRHDWVIHVDVHQVMLHLCTKPTLVVLIFPDEKFGAECFPLLSFYHLQERSN